MKQILSLAYRPKTLGSLIGQEELVKKIRGHFRQGRWPQAWLFAGETGAGKTTIARILALVLQCKHQEQIGNPCKVCQKKYVKFDIVEINASHIRQVEDLEHALEGYNYVPNYGSKARVYILDEAQMLSKHSQNLLLKFLEDCPKTTFWFICTTNPEKILATVQRRCIIYKVPGLQLEGVRALVKAALKYVGSEKEYSDLADALNENGVTSAGKVMVAVEKYLAGETAEAAAIGIASDVDSHTICRALIKGQWQDVAKQLEECKPEDVRLVAGSVSAYLRAILLGEVEFSKKAKVVAQAILKMGELNGSDSMQLSGLVAILHTVCALFARYKE